MIKRLLFAIFIICGSITAFAQYPNAPNKMRLGAQTTGDGLVFRTDSIPDWTPSNLNNAWLAIDTLTGNAYSYQGGEWRLEVAGDLRTVYPKVINKSGTNIKRGQPVMVDYNQIIQGDLIRILPANGSGTYAGILTMGIASTDINNNAEGFITWFGYVREVKQADIAETGVTLNVGDILYLSGTQLGKLTNVEPTAPKLRVTMALVVRKPNANNMTILVRPSLNSDLGELNDVDLTGLLDGQTIVYDSVGGKWIAGNVGSVIDTTVIATRAYVDGKVDSTRLVADSILVYYIGGVEVGRDTIAIPAAGITSFTLAGTSGTPQTITDGNTLTVAAGVGISTTAAATDQVTVAADTTTVLASKTFLSTRGYTTGSGTTGTIPIWSSSTALGNSALTEASGSVTAGGTGFFRLPNGTTAQRPGTPASGMTRYNTSNGALEYYGASAWEVPLKATAATGLGTATRLFYADANGRATDTTTLTYADNQLNATFIQGAVGGRAGLTFPGSFCQNAISPQTVSAVGAIEITVPVSVFSGNAPYQISFNLERQSRTVRNVKYKITAVYTPGGTPSVIVISEEDQSNINYRAGRDSLNNLKIWIGELTSNFMGGEGTYRISNIFLTQQFGFSRPPNVLCNAITITHQTTAFTNATAPRLIGTYFNALVNYIQHNNGNYRSTFAQKNGVFAGSSSSTFGGPNGAYEFTVLRDSALWAAHNDRFKIQLDFSQPLYNGTTVNFRVMAEVNFATGVWSNAVVDFLGGTPTNVNYNVRLGNDGTNLKIWVGELTDLHTNWKPLIITNAIVSHSTTFTLVENIATYFTNRLNWQQIMQPTAFGTVNQTINVNSRNSIPYSSTNRHAYSNNFTYNPTTNRLAVGDTTATRTLTVNGEVRITDLTTDNPTRIVGADADGDLNQIIVGTGLTLSNDTLRSTATGTTNLTFSGTSSPITLNSDTGTDVRFVNGNGISLTRAGDSMTVAKALPIYANLSLLAPQTLSFLAGSTTPDTIPSLFLSQLGSVFSMDGNGLKYTSSTTRYFLISVHVSFKFAEASNIVTLQGWKTNGGTTVSLGPTSKVESLIGNEIMQCSFSGITSLVNNDIIRFGFAPAAHTGDDDLVVDTVTITITEI
jgi:hypothetical protein